jgi:hypothetical protein
MSEGRDRIEDGERASRRFTPRWSLKKVVGRWLLAALVVVLAVWILMRVWTLFGPQKPELSPTRMSLAKELIRDQVAPRISEAREKAGFRTGVVLHLENDPSDEVTDAVRAEIETQGILTVEPIGWMESSRRFLGLRGGGDLDPQVAARAARWSDADCALAGRVERIEMSTRGTFVEIRIALVSAQGSVVLDELFRLESSIVDDIVGTVDRWGGPRRFLAWAFGILLLPIFIFPAIRATVRKRSNGANAFMLGILTLAGALLAYLLIGMEFSGWVSSAVFVAAIAVAFVYNVVIMRFALHLEE